MSVLRFIPHLLYSQFFVTIPKPTTRFDGQTIIITGANTGLGFEAAKHVVQLGCSRLIIAVRNISKGEAAKKDLEQTWSRSSEKGKRCDIEVWQLDLSSFSSVQAFSARAENLDRIDVLLCNAGIATTKFQLVEGNESTITTNVISTFLLALLLLPKLKQSSATTGNPPHISIVTSLLHRLTTLSPARKEASIFAALSDRKKTQMSMSNRYNESKLLEILVVRELVSKHMNAADYPVVMNLVAPGFCRSSLMRDSASDWGMKIVYVLLGARTTEVGARTLVHAVSAGNEFHGKYLDDCVVQEPSKWVRSQEGRETQRRVWEELGEKLEGISPGILGTLKSKL